MKIKVLEINQFGRFENRKIELPEMPFTVIYGENEAGKSTIMNFILCTLFGYPQKSGLRKWVNSGAEDRLGGSLVFTGDDGQDYRLERVYARNDQPELFIGNSERGSIHKILHGIDRMLYQNVFCFDLDGLSGIEKTKPSDLNDLLLGAGMIGSSELTKLEQSLSKKTGLIFKKGGKNPEMNQLFRKLDQSGTDLRKWERKLDAFHELQQEIAKTRKEIQVLEDERKNVQARFMEWSAFSSVRPLIAGYRVLEEEISSAGKTSSFPEDGRSRFSDLEKQIAETEKEMTDLKDEIRFLDEAEAAKPVREKWIRAEGKLSAWFRSAARDDQDLREIDRLGKELAAGQAAYEAMAERLGPEWSPGKILKASVDLSFIRQLREKTEIWMKLVSEEKSAANALSVQHASVIQLEQRLKQLTGLRSEVDVNSLRTARRASPEQKEKPFSLLLVFVSVLLMTLLFTAFSALLFTFYAALPVLVLGLTLTAFYGWAALRSRQQGQKPGINEADHRREAEASLTEEQLSGAEVAYEQKTRVREHCKDQLEAFEHQLKEWIRENGYAIDNVGLAEETARLVGDARALLSRLDGMSTELEARRADHDQFIGEKRRLTEELSLPDGDALYIEQQFNMEKEKAADLHALKSKRDVYRRQEKHLNQKLYRLNEEQHSLFEQAEVENHLQFLEKADHFERLRSLLEKRDERWLQMIEISGGEDKLKHFSGDLDRGIWEGIDEHDFKNSLSELDGKIKEARDRLTEEQAESRNMEESDTYRDALDNYQQLLAAANSKSREWAVYRTAQWAINRAKDQYRRQRLPRILNRARDYFEKITSGEYVSLQLDQTGGFIAGRNDGRHFRADELSRGTAEQLYLSLRLALAERICPGEKLPLIIDEGLVNFDARRTDRVLSLLKEVSQERQVILFTCQPAALTCASSESVVTLSKAFR